MSPEQKASSAPIVEKIAADIESTVASISTVNGYSVDIASVERRKLRDPGNIPGHLKAVLAYTGDVEITEASTPRFQRRRQSFAIIVWWLSAEVDDATTDQQLIGIWADVYKALRVDRTRSNLAWNTSLPGYRIVGDAVTIDMNVEYECNRDDPRIA